MSNRNSGAAATGVARREYIEAIEHSAGSFADSSLAYSSEKVFAVQQLLKNNFALEVANNNPGSLKLAMYNVAAVGLTLNPQLGLAYLVPRRDKTSEPYRIVLDISYRGLVQIAMQSESIINIGAELVREKDDFKYRGKFVYPDHDFNPLTPEADRGPVIGGYCVAQLPSNTLHVHCMSLEDMEKIKLMSPSSKMGGSPWNLWEDQMQLKSLLKRTLKWVPASSPRMAKALEIINEENGEGIAIHSTNQTVQALPPAPDASEVSLSVRNTIAQLIGRANETQAFEACRELMESRIKQPSDLAFAYHELDKAKAESESRRDNEQAMS